MKNPFLVFLLPLALSACQVGAYDPIQPIPGSITYGGQPRGRLVKSPVGSVLPHQFYDETGRRTAETYIVQPDHSLKLVERHSIEPPI
ncbi:MULTISPECIES: hypothetical protein [unclassified Rhizobium]|uniref:hypothetical protein n=1 Tax=unclassified Rhizobium TaxID=2613769 RepID=UPI001AD95BBD|nr:MULTISPECIES: hypothetical protein [unclassified Rhizobium]MBO9102153.1 hypothetical protein [Rhizobium sp. L58/93]MBO9171915.1 hypothetical protein [Rhizobium sp. L245/93]MBO9186426.1 hypothetical protein [Rhizobium sp. E27B/91]QXZ87218.1 hypothetical protein J5287_21915 [Rhizobium sp. K1/93]QXZ92749.1 hypothetical protein J5280_18980 [Rhizobium sp. K15/93]